MQSVHFACRQPIRLSVNTTPTADYTLDREMLLCTLQRLAVIACSRVRARARAFTCVRVFTLHVILQRLTPHGPSPGSLKITNRFARIPTLLSRKSADRRCTATRSLSRTIATRTSAHHACTRATARRRRRPRRRPRLTACVCTKRALRSNR